MADENRKNNRNDLFKRLTQLFRGGPNVKKKVRAFRAPAASTAVEVFKKSYSQVYSNALNAYGSYDRMSRYADFCFAGDTLVYTTKGAKTLKELASICSDGTRVNVYAYDLSTKTVKIAEAHSARLAREGIEQDLLRVTFDDGGHVDVTPDHSFLLKGGEYVKACDLKPNMSLQPFYRRDITGDGYKWIYTNDRERSKGGWITEHLMVMEHFLGRRLADDEVVHHKDFQRSNNLLENLELMSQDAHAKFHTQLNNINKFGKPAQKHSAWMINNNPSKRKDITFEIIVKTAIECKFVKKNVIEFLDADQNVINRRIRERGFKNWYEFQSKQNEIQKFLTHSSIVQETRSPSIQEILEVSSKFNSLHEISCALRCTTNAISRRLHAHGYGSWTEFKTGVKPQNKKGPKPDKGLYQKICNAYHKGMTQQELGDAIGSTKNKVLTSIINEGFKCYSEWVKTFENHKVKSIETINGKQQVFNITVEGFHNLAVGSINPNNSNAREYSMVFAKQSEMEYCLAGETKIATPDGYKTIEQLSNEYGLDKEFYVYAYDHEKKQIVPAVGKQARQTRIDEAFKVTFDSGLTITGTANHRLMLRDGSYKRIDELISGDSMMPFYRRDFYNAQQNIKGAEPKDGYRWIYTANPSVGRNGWVSEHRFVAEWISGRCLLENEVVHHKNFKKSDNRPENLQIMDASEHHSYHAKILNGAKWSSDNKEWIEKFKEQHSRWMKDNNPAERTDITFGQILETCESVGFNISKLCDIFKTDPNVIKRKLRRFGFKNFEVFAKAYVKDWKNAGWDNSGDKNPMFDDSLTFQMICDAYLKGMSFKQLQEKLQTTHSKITKRLKWAGYKNFRDFERKYENHKVVSVEPVGVIPLFDLTVDGYKNFATDSVISHNTPEIASALDIYAEESTSVDDKSVVLHVYSDNTKIHDILNNLLHDVLNVEHNLTPWTRNLVKFGDFFLFIDIHPDMGVVNVFPMPINEVERDEGWDPSNPLAVRFRWASQGNQVLESWQVAHFRLMGNDAFLPYGSSILESARRIWRQLILIEDAMLVYRVVRSPERRVFYIDVGSVPNEDISNYMEAAQSKLKRSPVIDKQTGRIDLRYNPLPIWSQSRIPLLDGRTITIEQLAKEYDEGKENWVYSIQDKTQQLVPGVVKWCGKNYTADKLTKVWLDDDTWVMTAPEHPFVMRDGSKKRADELCIGDSLMPLYRRMSSKDDGDYNTGYETVYNPGTDTWVQTHRAIALDSCVDYAKKIDEGVVVHHVNHQKWDNRPTNLQRMGWFEHKQHHADANRSPDHRAMVAFHNKRLGKAQRMSAMYNGTELHKSHNMIRQKAMIDLWRDPARRNVAKKNMQWVITDELRAIVYGLIKANPNVGRSSITMKLRTNHTFMTMLRDANVVNKRNIERIHIDAFVSDAIRHGKIAPDRRGWLSFKRWVCENVINHSVMRIESVDMNDDVYCMTIVGPKGEDDRHNFAVISEGSTGGTVYENLLLAKDQGGRITLSGGIYLGNSVDEDYFIPIRGSESGTKIDTLAGGQHVSDIADVEYIQKKLFAAIKVPRAYLGYDESLSSKATLAQEDIRFSRSISRIQRVLISELEKICIIHLFAHGYEGEDLTDFTLQLSNPSTVAQMQKLELWRTKFEIAGTVPEGLTDRDFIRKEIFQLTDDRIEKIKEGRKTDRIEDLELEASELENNEPAGGGGAPGGLGGLPGGGGLSSGMGGMGDMGGEPQGEEAPESAAASGDTGEHAGGEEGEGEDLFAGEEDKSEGGTLLATEQDSDVNKLPKNSLARSIMDIRKKEHPGTPGARKSPANSTPLSKYLYNRGRIKTHGAMKTHMPDFQGVLELDNDAYDKRFFRAGPFSESTELSSALLVDEIFNIKTKKKLSAEMKIMLSSLRKRIGNKVVAEPSSNVLTEEVKQEADIDVIIEDDNKENDVLDGIIDVPLNLNESES